VSCRRTSTRGRPRHAGRHYRHESPLHGIRSEEEIAQSLKYPEGSERLLKQLPDDQLRKSFDALGVRLEDRFAPNPDPKSRRQRVPVGAS